MDKQKELVFIENQLIFEIKAIIEQYIKEEMSEVDKIRAKANSESEIRRTIIEFCKANNTNKESIVQLIKEHLINKTEKESIYAQEYNLLIDVINNISDDKKEKFERDI